MNPASRCTTCEYWHRLSSPRAADHLVVGIDAGSRTEHLLHITSKVMGKSRGPTGLHPLIYCDCLRPMVSVINFHRTVWSASLPHMRRNLFPHSRQNGWLAAVALGIFILLSHMTAWPVLAQDLDLDLPEESGPAGVHPAQPPSGKPEVADPPGEKPPTEAAREAPQESPQVQYERRPEKGMLGNISDRLLNVLSGDNGANRTAVIGRFQISGEYRDRRDGSSQLVNVERLDIPLGDRMIFRTDLPFLRYDPQVSGSSSQSGLGDILTKLGGQVWARPAFTMFLEGQVIFPTASDTNLGGGKYQFIPGLTFSIPIQRLDTVFIPVVQQTVSFGGDPSRKSLNFTKLTLDFTTMWANNLWWTSIEPDLYVDWTQKCKTAVNLEFEVGRRLGDHFRVWLRPAVGLWGTGVPGAYDWFTQVGIRYMF